MALLAFERKLDSTIMRKRLDIQEALKRPMKQKRKLRIFISNTAFPAKEASENEGVGANSSAEASTASWELRVEGRVIDEDKKVSASWTYITVESYPCKISWRITSYDFRLTLPRASASSPRSSSPWSSSLTRTSTVRTTTWSSGTEPPPRKRPTVSRYGKVSYRSRGCI